MSSRTARGTTFSSLHVRNYRVYFIGQLGALSGTWMQTLARSWLVLDLAGGEGVAGGGLAVGLVTALETLPTLVLGAWGGVLADRFDKRNLLVVTSILAGIVAMATAVLTLSGAITLWMVYVLTLLSGLVNMADLPARQSFVSELVPVDKLTNAVGLNSALWNSARVVGPAIGGGVIVALGVGACFLVAALSKIPVVFGMLALRRSEMRAVPRAPRGKGQIREAFRYVMDNPELRSSMIFTGLVMAMVNSNQVVLPLLAKTTFGGDASTYSLMTVATGVGAVVGALAAARRAVPTTRVLLASGLGFGVAMVVVALAPSLWLSLPVLAVGGLFGISFASSSIAKAQLEAAPEMRGRVLALRLVTVVGSGPIGGPVVGWVSQVTNPRWGFVLCGVLPLGGAAWYWWVQVRGETDRARTAARPAVAVRPSGDAAD